MKTTINLLEAFLTLLSTPDFVKLDSRKAIEEMINLKLGVPKISELIINQKSSNGRIIKLLIRVEYTEKESTTKFVVRISDSTTFRSDETYHFIAYADAFAKYNALT